MAIAWLLRSRAKLTAAELAATFEVGARTIYRDIQALSEIGVPVVALPGSGGGYSLMEGFKLSPIPFNADEVEALWLAGSLMSKLGLTGRDQALQSALAKIFAITAPEHSEQAEVLNRLLEVQLERRGAALVSDELFNLLQNAAVARRTVWVRYRDVSDTLSDRYLTPDRLIFQRGAWYVQGADSHSGTDRPLRLDRIETCSVTDRPPVTATPDPDAQPVPVSIRMSAASARWYREHPIFRAWNPSEYRDGCLTLQVPRAGLSTLLATVLSFDGRETIAEPTWLAERLVANARAAIAAHEKPSEPRANPDMPLSG